jgi:hypothetical protein
MVGYDDRVDPGLESRPHDVPVGARAVRVAGMHVQIDDDLVHGGVVDEFPSEPV